MLQSRIIGQASSSHELVRKISLIWRLNVLFGGCGGSWYSSVLPELHPKILFF